MTTHTHEAAEFDGDRLAELIEAQLEVLRQLWQLGQQQQELIAAGRMAELLSLLAQKQPLLHRLSEVQQALRAAAGQKPATRRWSSPQRRDACQQQNAQCDALLAEILETEAASESSLSASRDALAVRLQQSSGALHAARAYHGAQTDGPRSVARLDLSSGR